MVISPDGKWGEEWVLRVRDMGKDATMPSELECEEGVEVMRTAGFLDIGHQDVLNIRGEVRIEREGIGWFGWIRWVNWSEWVKESYGCRSGSEYLGLSGEKICQFVVLALDVCDCE